jgi:hypothetical protein
MNSAIRNELLATLSQLAQRYPGWRMGQLLSNVAGWADKDIWDVDDEELLAAASLHLNNSTAQENAVAAD